MIWLLLACGGAATDTGPVTSTTGTDFVDDSYPYERLSTWAFFDGELSQLSPADGVLPYDVVARLWSDGAGKSRFMVLPEGGKVSWTAIDDWSFPDGSVIIKSFWFPLDRRSPDAERQHVETRLLVKVDDTWESHIYVWDDAQQEAVRQVAGSRVDLTFVDEAGADVSQQYIIPNENQCENCHMRDDQMHLLGPDNRQIDRDVERDGSTVNQVDWLADLGVFATAPPDEREAFVDPFGDGDIDDRVRSYLHANCSHCHRDGGGGGSSGLVLVAEEKDPSKRGLCKTTVAAGAGTGGFTYDVDPGSPDTSIMVYRMESTDPEIKMPELPNLVPDAEGVALVREWIAGLEGSCSD